MFRFPTSGMEYLNLLSISHLENGYPSPIGTNYISEEHVRKEGRERGMIRNATFLM